MWHEKLAAQFVQTAEYVRFLEAKNGDDTLTEKQYLKKDLDLDVQTGLMNTFCGMNLFYCLYSFNFCL